VHQIRFPLRFCPDPVGELTALPRPLTVFERPTFKGRGQEGREGEGKGEAYATLIRKCAELPNMG